MFGCGLLNINHSYDHNYSNITFIVSGVNRGPLDCPCHVLLQFVAIALLYHIAAAVLQKYHHNGCACCNAKSGAWLLPHSSFASLIRNIFISAETPETLIKFWQLPSTIVRIVSEPVRQQRMHGYGPCCSCWTPISIITFTAGT